MRSGVLDETGVAVLQGFADQLAISVHSAQTVVQLELQRVALESAANAGVVTDRVIVAKRDRLRARNWSASMLKEHGKGQKKNQGRKRIRGRRWRFRRRG